MQDHIHESNLIENIDAPREDLQSMKAWLWLLQQKKLDHSIICRLQKMITKNQTDLALNQRGYYRDVSKVNVVGGEYAGAGYHMVKILMDNWLLDHKTSDPLSSHIAFEKIHPFVDGNGRTGRMLLWWLELHKGSLPTLFSAWERHEKYYPLFRD